MQTANLKVEDLPGYREAVEREEIIRSAAFDDRRPELICGIEAQPLTMLHVIRLVWMRSPFVCGGEFPTWEQIDQLLWCVSREYEAALTVRNWISPFLPRMANRLFSSAKKRFLRQRKGIEYESLIVAIHKYVDEAFQDGPAQIRQRGFSAPYVSGATGAIGLIAKEFHWDDSAILRKPLKRIFQYHRWLEMQVNPKAVFFNPSDKVRSAALREIISKN